MANKGKNDDENDFYEGMAETADFIHDRLGVEGPIGPICNHHHILIRS
ncbi:MULTISPECIES: hypothetical protein [unclassified Paenibacillus]|nr:MULTISPECIES: hypothetical protein [unclassified Paenibacillus]MDQ0901026.1 hypothetical protein [Paenibacillus sp. V4I7]MDQ0920471.1 hypothetical protein [Paenibacillus sp. V4I5]